jgi:hypothetical protein
VLALAILATEPLIHLLAALAQGGKVVARQVYLCSSASLHLCGGVRIYIFPHLDWNEDGAPRVWGRQPDTPLIGVGANKWLQQLWQECRKM